MYTPPLDSGYPHGLISPAPRLEDLDYPDGHHKWGPHKTKAAAIAARDKNLRDSEARIADKKKMDAQRVGKVDEASEFGMPLQPLEKFCRAVKEVVDSANQHTHQMMSFNDAWTYAQVKFPDLYAAAFCADPSPDPGREVTKLANRIGALAGKNFEFGWNFARQEIPQIFNRMTPDAARIKNRATPDYADRVTQKASKIFNRLVRAEASATRLPDSHAWNLIKKRHPGIYGLATGAINGSEALKMEEGVWALILKNETLP